MNTTKTGLVLEGGAMRGMFTAGVTDVMMEQGIKYDGAVGVSAGAVFGCNYKSRQPGRVIRYNTTYCKDPRYCSFRSLLKTGDLYGADFCYRELPEELDLFDTAAYTENPMEFHSVCTEVTTGKAVYHNCQVFEPDTYDWLRASASMPLASKVVKIGPHRLLDGGVADSIPLRYFEEQGYGRNVVVLTQPEGYVKGKNKLMPLIRVALRKYPAMIRAMEERPEMYNDTLRYIREREQAGTALVIRPKAPLDIGSVEHDPNKLLAVYRLGREAMEERLEELKAFLG